MEIAVKTNVQIIVYTPPSVIMLMEPVIMGVRKASKETDVKRVSLKNDILHNHGFTLSELSVFKNDVTNCPWIILIN